MFQGNTEDQNCRTREKQKLKRSKSTYESGQVTVVKVVVPVSDLFGMAVDFRTYRLVKQSERHNDDVAHELHCMEKKMAVQLK